MVITRYKFVAYFHANSNQYPWIHFWNMIYNHSPWLKISNSFENSISAFITHLSFYTNNRNKLIEIRSDLLSQSSSHVIVMITMFWHVLLNLVFWCDLKLGKFHFIPVKLMSVVKISQPQRLGNQEMKISTDHLLLPNTFRTIFILSSNRLLTT